MIPGILSCTKLWRKNPESKFCKLKGLKSKREEKSKQIAKGVKCNWSNLTGDL